MTIRPLVQIPIRLSTRLAQIRHRAGLTQSELAELADAHPKSISAYETGCAEPRVTTLLRIIAACGSTPAKFFDCQLRMEPLRHRRGAPTDADLDLRAIELREASNG